MISEKLKQFGTTVFSEMTRLAKQHDAINLSQGFPDFEGPPEIIDAAVDVLRSGYNQYARSRGMPNLVNAIAHHQRTFYDLSYDPLEEVVVFSGATEGLMSAMLGILNPGDEVILFEPYYDSYPACVAMAGATPRYVTLEFPNFEIDFAHLESCFNENTRMIVLNTPHNPTGKVFSRSELEGIAALARKHDVVVLTDEVYEHLTYDEGAPHIPMATLPGMRERTLTISSTGKTYSFTGWKVGWATGPRSLVDAAQAAHQFVTFATATPLQEAVAYALEHHAATFYDALRTEYAAKRAHLMQTLAETGLVAAEPAGTYFVLCDFRPIFAGDDVAFARHLVEDYGVAAIPPSGFYAGRPEAGQHLVRFAFCKTQETLNAARMRLMKLKA